MSAGAPIGVYDSGIGGISVLRALREALPSESFVYVADNGYAPYGGRPRSGIEARAHAVATFLVGTMHVKAIVIACNTASVVAAASLRAAFALPIVAMEPAIKPAVAATRTGTVLVLATANTIESDAVARLCRDFGAGKRVLLQACPGLVEQVERGEFASASTHALLMRYVRPAVGGGADTIVLGCTHYAFLADAIRHVAGPSVQLIEPSAAIARRLVDRLPRSSTGSSTRPRPTEFYASGALVALRESLARVGETDAAVYELPGDGVAHTRSARHAG